MELTNVIIRHAVDNKGWCWLTFWVPETGQLPATGDKLSAEDLGKAAIVLRLPAQAMAHLAFDLFITALDAAHTEGHICEGHEPLAPKEEMITSGKVMSIEELRRLMGNKGELGDNSGTE